MANLSSRRQLFTWFIIVAPCILIFLWTSGFNSMHHDDSVMIERRVHDEEEDVRPKSPVPERHQRVPPARKSFQEVRKSPERLTHTTQQQQVRKRTFDPLSTHEGDNDDVAFHQWCLGLLRKAFGRSITDAVYDPILFNLLVQTLERDEHDSSDPYLHWPFIDDEFVYSDINAPVTPPTHFRTIGEALWWTKRWTSVAITKITRDSELEKLYRRMTIRSASSSTSELKMKLLENTFIRAFTAQVQHFHIVLQVVTDATLTAEQRVMIRHVEQDLRRRHQKRNGGGEFPSGASVDPLVIICGGMTADTTISNIELIFSSQTKLQEAINARIAVEGELQQQRGTSSAANEYSHAQNMFPINYDDVPYDKSRPLNGKYWNMLRPTAGCSSIVRLCEIPDGCRLLCNGEYLLNAGLLRSDTTQERNRSASLIPPANSSASGGSANIITTQPPTTNTGGALPPSSHHLPPPSPPPRPPPPPYQHRLIGMGCNNQYDWELSLLAMFQGASLSSNHTTHRLGWTTSMDCTLTVETGKRQWNVPQVMRDAQIGFTGVSLCGGARRLQANELGPNHIKRFQLKTEWDVAAAAAAASRQPSPSLNNKQYVHYSIHPDAVHAATSRGDFTESFEDQRFTMGGNTEENHTLSRLSSQPRWFDALSIFKVDIEGSEWKYIPAWIRGEFYSLQTHAPLSLIRSGSAAAIDFSAYAPDFFTVSLFFLEYHRIGRDDTGATAVGGLRAHWLTLQIYALGFIMIAHEKNEFSQRCFEHAYVHVRHFIRSEMWMLLRDDI